MKLSENFELKEFTFSQIAAARGISNEPNQTQVLAILALVAHVIQPARTALNFALSISSGFRSYQLNKLLRGAKTSQHLSGEAADITCKDNAKLFNWIAENVEFDQLIWEFGDDNQPDWVHVSYTTKRPNRKQKLIARKANGVTQYVAY